MEAIRAMVKLHDELVKRICLSSRRQIRCVIPFVDFYTLLYTTHSLYPSLPSRYVAMQLQSQFQKAHLLNEPCSAELATDRINCCRGAEVLQADQHLG